MMDEHAVIGSATLAQMLVGVVILAATLPPFGVFLMLRRMSMTGDAIAHGVLPGVAIAFLAFGMAIVPMMIGGVLAGLAVALLSGLVARTSVLREDTSLATFYLISLALGVLLVSRHGSSVDLDHVLFGDISAMGDHKLVLAAVYRHCDFLACMDRRCT
jgi:zinc/manganese transport system permease protein